MSIQLTDTHIEPTPAVQGLITLPNNKLLQLTPFPKPEEMAKIYEDYLNSFFEPLEHYIKEVKDDSSGQVAKYATKAVARHFMQKVSFIAACKSLHHFNPESKVLNKAMKLGNDFIEINLL